MYLATEKQMNEFEKLKVETEGGME